MTDVATEAPTDARTDDDGEPPRKGRRRKRAREEDEPDIAGGTRIGRYIVLYRLGFGGMGRVYAAHDPQLDRRLAMQAASDELIEEATKHRLVPIASLLPPNPRQIKRIINGIALFEGIARILGGVQPGSPTWCRLAA